MKQTLDIDSFLEFANNTGKYNRDQLQAIYDSLDTLEQEMSELSWKENEIYSHRYIFAHLTKCCNRLKVFLMTNGLRKPKAEAVVADFKKWMKAYMS